METFEPVLGIHAPNDLWSHLGNNFYETRPKTITKEIGYEGLRDFAFAPRLIRIENEINPTDFTNSPSILLIFFDSPTIQDCKLKSKPIIDDYEDKLKDTGILVIPIFCNDPKKTKINAIFNMKNPYLQFLQKEMPSVQLLLFKSNKIKQEDADKIWTLIIDSLIKTFPMKIMNLQQKILKTYPSETFPLYKSLACVYQQMFMYDKVNESMNSAIIGCEKFRLPIGNADIFRNPFTFSEHYYGTLSILSILLTAGQTKYEALIKIGKRKQAYEDIMNIFYRIERIIPPERKEWFIDSLMTIYNELKADNSQDSFNSKLRIYQWIISLSPSDSEISQIATNDFFYFTSAHNLNRFVQTLSKQNDFVKCNFDNVLDFKIFTSENIYEICELIHHKSRFSSKAFDLLNRALKTPNRPPISTNLHFILTPVDQTTIVTESVHVLEYRINLEGKNYIQTSLCKLHFRNSDGELFTFKAKNLAINADTVIPFKGTFQKEGVYEIYKISFDFVSCLASSPFPVHVKPRPPPFKVSVEMPIFLLPDKFMNALVHVDVFQNLNKLQFDVSGVTFHKTPMKLESKDELKPDEKFVFTKVPIGSHRIVMPIKALKPGSIVVKGFCINYTASVAQKFALSQFLNLKIEYREATKVARLFADSKTVIQIEDVEFFDENEKKIKTEAYGVPFSVNKGSSAALFRLEKVPSEGLVSIKEEGLVSFTLRFPVEKFKEEEQVMIPSTPWQFTPTVKTSFVL